MVAGPDTYISRLLEYWGFQNLVLDSERYPVIDLGEISKLSPDFLMLSTEPFPFRKRDLPDFEGLGIKRILKVDGRMMSWHGVHLLDALKGFSKFQLSEESNLFRGFNQQL